MAYNAASNFVHWGEGASEFGENLGTYMAFTGSIGTGITLATPGLEESTPGLVAIATFGIGLHASSEITHVSLLGIDAFAFGGSKTEFYNEGIHLGISAITGAIMNPIEDKML
ncbi:MAG: hypothetical protein WCA84_11365 [Ignavibacteriaceae bacterium]